MRRKTAFVLCLALIFSLCFTTAPIKASAASNRLIQSVTVQVNGTEVENDNDPAVALSVGDVISVIVKTEDLEEDPVFLQQFNDKGKRFWKDFEKTGDNEYTATIPVDDSWRNDDYVRVEDLTMIAFEGNSKREDLYGGSRHFTLKDSEELDQGTLPGVYRMTFDKHEAKPGDLIHATIIANFVDESIGEYDREASIEHDNYWHPDYVYSKLTPTEKENEYTAEFKITDKCYNGNYAPREFIFNYHYGNKGQYTRYLYYSFYDDNIISISDSKVDREPPIVESVTMNVPNGAEVCVGDEIVFTVYAHDEKTDIDPDRSQLWLTGFLYSPRLKLQKKDDGVYEASITINSNFIKDATYSVSFLDVVDSVGNEQYASSLAKDLSFVVKDGTSYTQYPRINSVGFDKNEAEPGDVVTVKVKAKADEGIDPARSVIGLTYEGESTVEGKKEIRSHFVASEEEDDTYLATFKVTHAMMNGFYHMTLLNMVDTKGNIGFITPVNLGFTVKNSAEDIVAPEIISLSQSTDTVKKGQSITFTLKATDENTGVDLENTHAVLTSKQDDKKQILRFVKGEDDNTYTATVATDGSWETGEYTVSGLTVSDLATNETSSEESLTFTVEEAPKLEITEFVLDKTIVKQNESITFTLKVDSDAGLNTSKTVVYFSNESKQYSAKFKAVSGEPGTYTSTIKLSSSKYNTGDYTVDKLVVVDKDGNEVEAEMKNCQFTVYSWKTSTTWLNFLASLIDFVGKIVDWAGGSRNAIDILQYISSVMKTLA